VPRGSTASTIHSARGAIFHLGVVVVVGVLWVPHVVGGVGPRLPTTASEFAEGPCSSRRRGAVGGALARGALPSVAARHPAQGRSRRRWSRWSSAWSPVAPTPLRPLALTPVPSPAPPVPP
jgi:hypothetical protein